LLAQLLLHREASAGMAMTAARMVDVRSVIAVSLFIPRLENYVS